MMTAFAENTLGMLYREKGSDGSWRGGAMPVSYTHLDDYLEKNQ